MNSRQNLSEKDLYGFPIDVNDKKAEKEFSKLQSELIEERDKEWNNYLKSVGGLDGLKPAGNFKPSAELKQNIRRGIPVAWRGAVWQKISLSSQYKAQKPLDYYQKLLSRVDELSSKVVTDIEKDLDRTFPLHDFFENTKGSESLRRLLSAYGVHNPTVGYCQSLNFIAGIALLFLEEEDAFWLFATILEKLLPEDYYTKSMIGTYCDQYVFAHIIKKFLPKVHLKLEEFQLQLPLITVQWFMCLFVNTLRSEVVLRVWDMFLNEGSKVLFRIAISLFKQSESRLLAAKDGGDLFSILRTMGNDIINPEELISLAYTSYVPLKLNRSPRQRANSNNRNSFNSAPPELLGLGVAHVGPLTQQIKIIETNSLKECTTSSNITKLENIDGNNILSNISIENNISHSSYHKGGSVYEVQSPYPTPSPHNTFLAKSSSNTMSNSIMKISVSRLKSYIKFKRADIERWRADFRPELEVRFITMELARKQWKEEAEYEKRQLELELEDLENEKKFSAENTITELNRNRNLSEYSPHSSEDDLDEFQDVYQNNEEIVIEIEKKQSLDLIGEKNILCGLVEEITS